jgi:hypothetical protein
MRRTLVFASLVAASLVFVGNGFAGGPLATGLIDPAAFTGPEADTALARVRAAGATFVRLQLIWALTAPATRPKGFEATAPGDPAYQFGYLDREVTLARKHGLEPIVYVQTAPRWAQTLNHGFRRPDPKAFGAFALAAARRYSGSFDRLPRVRFWQVWNEPNKVARPAMKPSQPDWYRQMVESFAAAVHRVHGDNAVIAGGLSPFGLKGTAVAPLDFMRRLLCMSAGPHFVPTCSRATPFEIWSTHPYTSGGPTHMAAHPDDVSLGNLPEMKALLDAAVRAHHVRSRRAVRFWVTEFGWDSDPPDPQAVPMKLLTRWVAEALYRMWAAGVSLCIWFRLDDDPLSVSPYQTGLYFHSAGLPDERPKPSLQAFRFPFVAFPRGGRIFVWGRTPAGKAGRVVVEQRSGGWLRVATLATDRYGIFTAVIAGRGSGDLRAELVGGGTVSVPFSLTAPPDRFVNPFGS